MKTIRKYPLSISINLVLILLNILFWLIYGIFIAFNLHPALPESAGIKWFMVVASLVNAGVLLGLFIALQKKMRLAYQLSIAFFILMSLLTIFDEVGWIDMLVLAINILPIVLLIKDKKWYLG